jgi:hypothetical protein
MMDFRFAQSWLLLLLLALLRSGGLGKRGPDKRSGMNYKTGRVLHCVGRFSKGEGRFSPGSPALVFLVAGLNYLLKLVC